MEDLVLRKLEQEVLMLTLNRPDALNAMNPPMMRELLVATQDAARDPAVRCVILTGAGRGFCAGGDRKAAAAATATTPPIESGKSKKTSFEYRVAWLRQSMEAARLLHEMSKPTIAMINGPCAGAGLSLAGACDFRFAGAAATFTSAFTRGGLSGDYGGSWFWTRILGTARARQLYLLSEKFDAAAALAFGLVNEVIPDDQLHDRVIGIANGLAALPGEGIAYAKGNLNRAELADLPTVMDQEALSMMLSRRVLTESKRAAEAK